MMNFRTRWTASVLTLLAGITFSLQPSWGCEAQKFHFQPRVTLQAPNTATATDWPRPTCAGRTTHLGLCFAANMPLATQITRSQMFKASQKAIAQKAQAYLDGITPASHKVIVTDLDDTVIETEGYYASHPVLDPPTWERWSDDTAGKVQLIEPIWTLLKTAKAKGFKVMFITGRPEHMTISTLKQMPEFDWDGIYLKPQGVSVTSTVYKTQVRQMLRNLGYEIVLTLGDQPSDFDLPVRQTEGEFLLPNVMYAIP